MGKLLTASSVMLCPHGGKVNAVSSNARAKAMGGYILRSSDTFLVASCPFMIGPMPHPCVTVKWIVAGKRAKAAGNNVLTSDSVGICQAADNAPQGPVMVAFTQPRVAGQ